LLRLRKFLYDDALDHFRRVGQHARVGGKDAMRNYGRALARILVSGLTGASGQRLFTGLTVGITAVTLSQQTIGAFGLDAALTCGMLAGLVCGAWATRRPAASSPAVWDAIYLAAVIGLWPVWMTTLVDGVRSLPASAWSFSLLPEGLSFLAGLLSLGVPATAWFRLIGATKSSEHSLSLGAISTGALLHVCALAPLWGLWWPACVAVGLLTAIALRNSRFVLAPGESPGGSAATNIISPAPSVHTRLESVAAVCIVLALGLLVGESTRVLAELWPVSATLWHAGWIAVLAGVAGGCLVRCPPPPIIAWLTGCLAVAAVCLAASLTDVSLWMNYTLTSVATLELGRIALIVAVLAPAGALFGTVNSTARSSAALLTAFIVGIGGTAFSAATGGNPVHGLLLAGLLSLVTVIAVQIAQRPVVWRWRAALTAVLVAALTGSAAWTGGVWQPTHSARLLFSTHMFLAARTGWDRPLLAHLDDLRPLAHTSGRHGTWTLWQARGGEVQLRENGIPSGTLTTAADWSPQFAPEVLPVVWPLVLVDQPARVLMLGARSGAGLQAALVFPLRELVCQEPDAAVVQLVRGPVAKACGHDPFSDDRCRWVRQPEGWLAPVSDERFDVIVSQPATAALQSCAEEFTTEFYRRAATQLAEEGVFCQRFSSIDFGPQPLLTAVAALQTAFPETACLEIGTGEYLLLGAWQPTALVRPDLPERLETPHVAALLARCQWDWVMGLNLPAYDRAALAEAAREAGVGRNSAARGQLPFTAARELMRWAPKLQETAVLLSKPREAAAVYPLPDDTLPPQTLTAQKSRKSRYLEWLGAAGENPAVLRRLAEIIGQQQLVANHPDTHWYEYRKELREQLQDHPRTALQQVSHVESWHPEDRQRKAYFEALGAASKSDRPDPQQLQALEAVLEPTDPLLTLFGHQELAELYSRGNVDPTRELQHRLHVIYYAPSSDISVRNVVAAIDHVVAHPEAIPNEAQRFDVLNGLLQTLRARWEGRNQRPPKSVKVTTQEIERSLVSVERAVQTLEPLAATVGYTPDEWAARETVLDRLLIRPFRTYRDELKVRARTSELKTRALLERAAAGE
jgi:hypothetical protein